MRTSGNGLGVDMQGASSLRGSLAAPQAQREDCDAEAVRLNRPVSGGIFDD